MFCSKCGKEVQEGATFCSNCGAATVLSVQDTNTQKSAFLSRNRLPVIPTEEKSKKNAVVIVYLINAIMYILFFLITLSTKLKFLSYLFDTNVPQGEISAAMESLYDKYSTILWCLSILYFSVPIAQGIVIWRMWKKRNFNLRKKRLVAQCVADVVFWLFSPLIIKLAFYYSPIGHIQGKVTFLMYLIMMIYIIMEIIYTVMYYKAAECEESNIYDEEYNALKEANTGSWICEECLTANSANTPYCKNCGQYK